MPQELAYCPDDRQGLFQSLSRDLGGSYEETRSCGCCFSIYRLGLRGGCAAQGGAATDGRTTVGRSSLSWTGFYLGGTLGADTVKSNEGWTIDPVLNVDVPAAIAAREALSAQTLKATSVFGGPEVGYNLQYGMAVFGVEGDINWGSASTTSFFPSLAPLFLVPGNNLTEGVDLNWLATVRGRIGLAWNQFLIYGTGGYAAGGVRFFDSSHYAAGVTETADVSKTMSGWVAGGGVEWAFAGNWSVKGEFLHADLGSATTFSSLLPAFRVGFSHAHSVTVDVARAGLNYKF